MFGYLMVEKRFFTWQRKYFEVDLDAKTLKYSLSPTSVQKKVIRLQDATIAPVNDPKGRKFLVRNNQKLVVLKAPTRSDCDHWLLSLRETQHTQSLSMTRTHSSISFSSHVDVHTFETERAHSLPLPGNHNLAETGDEDRASSVWMACAIQYLQAHHHHHHQRHHPSGQPRDMNGVGMSHAQDPFLRRPDDDDDADDNDHETAAPQTPHSSPMPVHSKKQGSAGASRSSQYIPYTPSNSPTLAPSAAPAPPVAPMRNITPTAFRLDGRADDDDPFLPSLPSLPRSRSLPPPLPTIAPSSPSMKAALVTKLMPKAGGTASAPVTHTLIAKTASFVSRYFSRCEKPQAASAYGSCPTIYHV